MSLITTLFPHLRGFRFRAVARESARLTFQYERITRSAPCPLCGAVAHRIHSHYQRRVWDMPIEMTSVVLLLQVRKWYCDNAQCPRKIFTERLPHVTMPHGRYTHHLRQVLAQLGQEHGGASGARSGRIVGVQVTERTILRLLHAQPLPEVPPPRIIGLDDWAWKRRQRYGAIVVDLERATPIALLPERSVDVVRRWLQEHPTITIVARDRSQEFATAITQALPQAQQVADRWHLAHNLTELLDTVVASRWKLLLKALRPAETPLPLPQHTAHHTRHLVGDERYQQAHSLAQAGVPVVAIAEHMGVGARTIRRWLAQQRGPHTVPRKPRRGPFDWTTAYLRERWEAGEYNGMVLWEALRTQGFTGSSRSVYRRLRQWRAHPYQRMLLVNQPSSTRSPWSDLTPGKVVGWIIARPEHLRSQDRERLERICQVDEVLAQARMLMQQWLTMIRRHTAEPLERWLQDVRTSALPQWLPFARSIERDKAAIVAGLTLPYSTGPVEGHINRLKLIKREAYGKASLEYLQQRFLAGRSAPRRDSPVRPPRGEKRSA